MLLTRANNSYTWKSYPGLTINNTLLAGLPACSNNQSLTVNLLQYAWSSTSLKLHISPSSVPFTSFCQQHSEQNTALTGKSVHLLLKIQPVNYTRHDYATDRLMVFTLLCLFQELRSFREQWCIDRLCIGMGGTSRHMT